MKLKRSLLSIVLILMVLLTASNVTYAEKSDMEIAKEIVYGKWGIKQTDRIKYEFSEKNIRILKVLKVDPYGESRMKVQMRSQGVGEWITLDTVFFIDLVNDHYEMYMVKRRDNGDSFQDGDHDKRFAKVYWTAKE